MANRNYNTAPKRKAPKKPYLEIYWRRQDQFLGLIHSWKEITDYDLKRVLFGLGWGPRIFEDMRRDVRDGCKTEVQYMKKEKNWVSLKPIEGVKETQIEETCSTNPLLTAEQNKIPLSS